MPFMVLALLSFFVSIGTATFIEEWYSTEVAQKWVYRAVWFEMILWYLAISMIVNIFRYKLLQMKKAASLVFHTAFLVILVGAWLTRYVGFEGVMTIREGTSSNEIITMETYMQIKVHDNEQQYVYDEPVMWEKYTHNEFDHEVLFPGQKEPISFSFVSVMENVKDTIVQVGKSQGDPYLEIVTVGQSGRFYNYLRAGDVLDDGAFKISFNNNDYTEAIRVNETDSGLVVVTPFDIGYLQMSDEEQGIIKRDSAQPFIQKRLYTVNGSQFAFNAYYKNAEVKAIESEKEDEGYKAVTIHVKQGKHSKDVVLRGGKGIVPSRSRFKMGDLEYVLGYGAKKIELPFYIYLEDFELERYPGTDKPSSFASDVKIIDMERGYEQDYRIFMNNVMDYRGYRFFQSSYDPDEGGTILSVNKDRPGTYTTYVGYTLLGLGFMLSFFQRNSRFQYLIRKTKELHEKRSALSLLFLVGFFTASSVSFSQETAIQEIDYDHAERYGELVIQDEGGRFKPVHTLATDVLKKVHRGTDYNGLSPMQVFLGIHTDAMNWQEEPLIYVSGQPVRDLLGIEGKYASLHDFFGLEFNTYALAEDAEIAKRKKAASRNRYDKDVLKNDERVFVLYGLFTGYYLKILPKKDDPNNTWYSPFDENKPFEGEDLDFVSTIIPYYNMAVGTGHSSGNWTAADKMVDLIDTYQRAVAPEDLIPSKTEIRLEIAYNKANVFKRVEYGYLIVGFFIMVFFFVSMLYPDLSLKTPMRIFTILFALLALAHGVGLGIRWYLSGHAPWSNGYEAVVWIAFVTAAMGILFSKQLKIVLGAAGILAWLMLFVAGMNNMDPQITNLVPVLKSYWLMIHVAIITGSYAFLGIGSILSLIVLCMNLFLNQENKKRMLMTTKEMTYITELVIIIGLFMLTIGTFLGGVWANESWGRYWGWDAKETWALASVVVYAMIMHFRFIPGLKSQFAFNVGALWGYGAIIMTFYGVNFYLSGLHSYAKGEPVPFPTWAKITILVLAILTVISYLRLRQVHGKKIAAEPAAIDNQNLDAD